MKADYLFALARILRARESGDEVLENNLLDELDGLWAEMTDEQRMRINEISAKAARRETFWRELRIGGVMFMLIARGLCLAPIFRGLM